MCGAVRSTQVNSPGLNSSKHTSHWTSIVVNSVGAGKGHKERSSPSPSPSPVLSSPVSCCLPRLHSKSCNVQYPVGCASLLSFMAVRGRETVGDGRWIRWESGVVAPLVPTTILCYTLTLIALSCSVWAGYVLYGSIEDC
jgi:hypothetical protein